VEEPKIPVFLAVGLWTASALAVLGYTYIAFRETAKGGLEGFVVKGGLVPTDVAIGQVLSAELTPNAGMPAGPRGPLKPLNRGKFNPSR
jgi:hypothetical protein